LSHVKDGVELAREYGLPTSLLPIIQQHHGTTLVEYFYHQAVTQQDQQADMAAQVNDAEYRYPGPKPKSKESAVVMLADAVESCARAMSEPTPARIAYPSTSSVTAAPPAPAADAPATKSA